MSSPYGYGGRPQDRPVGPPPGVLPPPQAAPYGGPPPGPFQQGPGQFQQPYPGQWAQPYYGRQSQFNGFQPPKRRGGATRLILFGFAMLVIVGGALAAISVILTGGDTDDTAQPRVTGPSIVPTPTSNPQKGSAEDYLLNAQIYRTGALP